MYHLLALDGRSCGGRGEIAKTFKALAFDAVDASNRLVTAPTDSKRIVKCKATRLCRRGVRKQTTKHGSVCEQGSCTFAVPSLSQAARSVEWNPEVKIMLSSTVAWPSLHQNRDESLIINLENHTGEEKDQSSSWISFGRFCCVC